MTIALTLAKFTYQNGGWINPLLSGAFVGAAVSGSPIGALYGSITTVAHRLNSPKKLLLSSIAFTTIKLTLDHYTKQSFLASTSLSAILFFHTKCGIGSYPVASLIGRAAVSGLAAPPIVHYIAKHHFSKIPLLGLITTAYLAWNVYRLRKESIKPKIFVQFTEVERQVIDEIKCAISLESPSDPVLDPTDKNSIYERGQIEKWFKEKQTSPVTRKPLVKKDLIPLPNVKALLSENNPTAETKIELLRRAWRELKYYNPQSTHCSKLQVLLGPDNDPFWKKFFCF